MQKLTPCLWFDGQAEEAAKFYVSLFKRSKILGITRYGKSASNASGRPAGSIMTVKFRLEGQEFLALNGGPHFKFTEAISFMVNCKTQKEVDSLWEKLSTGGQESQCGWLKDKFGLSWQIVPEGLPDVFGDKDPKKRERVMQAMLKMGKLDINVLKRARDAR